MSKWRLTINKKQKGNLDKIIDFKKPYPDFDIENLARKTATEKTRASKTEVIAETDTSSTSAPIAASDMTVDTSHLSAVEIIVPIKQDIKKAVTTAGNLISASARSFELVWDRSKNRLAFWLVSHKNDIEHYVETFKSVYPNAAFSRLDHNVPRWFDPENQVYQVFDVSVRHGHFFAVMDYQKVPVLITQISNTIQMAEYGWIQFVFAKYDLATRYMNQLSRRLDSMYQKVTNNKHLSLWEMILYQNRKPHEHPEFHGDFARNYKTLKQHIQTKTVNPQLIMSVRGLVKSDNDDEEVGGVVNDELDFGFDVIENLSMENIHTTFEHCTKNPYENYYKFYRDRYDDEDDLAEIECRPVNKLKKKTKPEYIRIGGKKKKRGKDGNQTLLQRISIFPLRLLPEPEKPLTQAVERYVGTNIFGSYHKRRPLPFLLLNTSEMPLFVHLPDNTVQHLRLTRGQTLPRTDNDKNGFRLGLFNIDKKGEENGIKNENDSNSNHSYGEIVSSNDIGGVVVHPDDLTRHLYVVGGSGSGKSTLLRSLAKHLEIANLNGTHSSAFIYADFKGGRNPDSIKFIKQLDKKTLDSGKVLYLDPSETNFSINPLELPRSYGSSKRDEIVDRYIGYFMRIMEQFYDQRQTYVQMERIMKVILQYLYTLDDAPTFRDVYEIVAEIELGGQQVLPEIFETLGKPEAELEKALSSISELKQDTFSPILNRLEPFSTSPILRRIFTTKHSSVDFSKLVKAGHYTVVSMNETNMSSIAAPLAQMAFVLKIWFEVQEQSRMIKKDSNETKQQQDVILVLDEFQIIAGLDAIPMMLAQARSFGLGLCLAHQNLSQISTGLLQAIVGNTATQLAGRISGIDASKVGMIIDPHYGKELAGMLAVQPDFRFTVRTRPATGEETSLPPQFWIGYPCKETMTDDQFQQFLSEQKAEYGNAKPQETLLVSKNANKNKWMQQLGGGNNGVAILPSKTEWQILSVLHDHIKPLSLMEIVRICNFIQSRDEISQLLRDMADRGLIEVAQKIQKGRITVIKYQLTQQSKQQYFFFFDNDKNNELDSSFFSIIGTAKDISYIASKAIQHYRQLGYYIGIASQDFSKKDKLRTDLIAYDYDNEIPISVEIESYSEVDSHPEHVLLNMKKWQEMGFLQCHVWSTHKKINEVKERLEPKIKENVKVFVV